MLPRHPPLEAGATRAVDPEQEAGPGCGLHVASQNAAALMGLDEPAELVIDAHPPTPSVELCCIQIQASTGGILFRRLVRPRPTSGGKSESPSLLRWGKVAPLAAPPVPHRR